MNIDEDDFKKYLSKFNCKGCYNHCVLSSPTCARSKIFIKEAMERYNNTKCN